MNRQLKNSAGLSREIITVKRGSAEYPDKLELLGQNAPDMLYCIGDIRLLKRRSAAVVGARKGTSYGLWCAYEAGRKLAENGITTVSGMALGCDSSSHKGAMDGGGETIAVLGSGVDMCYPLSCRSIYDRIIDTGNLIISEFKPGTPPFKYNFPQRNRLISGLSETVIITEASMSSGSLITAAFAVEQGKTVMAFPGNITNLSSLGANKLIQDGAIPVAGLNDIIMTFGLPANVDSRIIDEELGADEKKIFDIVRKKGEVTANQIACELKRNVSDINALVSIMEIKGFLITSIGKIYINVL